MAGTCNLKFQSNAINQYLLNRPSATCTPNDPHTCMIITLQCEVYQRQRGDDSCRMLL